MTLERLCAAVYADLNLGSVASAATLARIRRYLNEGVRAVFREPGLERLADSDGPYPFESSAGLAHYVVQEPVARIQRIVDRTNTLTLEAMPIDRYRRLEPDATSHSGTPTHYVPIGRVAVALQPVPPSALWAVSTSIGDVTQSVHVEGLMPIGLRMTAEAMLTGTTPVQLANIGSNAPVFEVVEDFYLTAPARGIVRLLYGSPTGPEPELARIMFLSLRPRYTAFYLWPTPSATLTYHVDYRRELFDMVNDSDEPPLPTDFHPMIAAYARMREYEKADDDRYALAEREYRQALNRLKFATQWASDELPVLGRAGRVGHSRLGANYPADSWR